MRASKGLFLTYCLKVDEMCDVEPKRSVGREAMCALCVLLKKNRSPPKRQAIDDDRVQIPANADARGGEHTGKGKTGFEGHG